MAKKSSIEKNKNRTKLVARFAAKRAALKAVADDQTKTIEERFEALL
jgi:small subunit ribosomal protein S14